MKSEENYVLKRIDEWHHEMVKIKYTPEVERSVKLEIYPLLLEEKLVRFVPILDYLFDRDNVLKESRDNFSRGYNTLERMLRSNANSPFSNMPKGVREEYIQPFLDKFKPLTAFVDEVKKKFEGSFPNELSDQDIEDGFKKTFPKMNYFVDYILQMLDVTSIPAEVLTNKTLAEKREIQKFNQGLKIIIPRLLETVMGHLYRVS